MQETDRATFAEQLAKIYSVYANAALTKSAIQAFWVILEPYTLDSVIGALNYHLGDFEGRGGWAPVPADIKRILDITFPDIIRKRVAAIMRDARERCEPYREHIALANTRHMLGLIDEGEKNTLIADAQRTIASIMHEGSVRQAAHGTYLYERHDKRTEPTKIAGPVKNALNALVARLGGRR